MIIAIDFDDTLMDKQRVQQGYRMGPPTPGAVAATQRLRSEGHTIIVFTARGVQDQRVYKAVMDWCEFFGIPASGATNIKSPDFDVIIDDKSIHFNSWPQTLIHLRQFEESGRITS
jgi:hypothetical protein